MADLCTIGPVSITDAHLFENNSFDFSNTATQIITSGSNITTGGQLQEEYGFDILCTADEALQLKGVVEQGQIIWMDTSSDLTDNNFLQHKGWVILTQLEISHMSPTILQCAITHIKISDHQAEYLTMDYSKGYYDGISLIPEYSITATNYQLQEDGSDITTNWTAACDYQGTLTASTDGAEFDLALAATTDGTPSWGWIRCDTATFTPPFTFETILDRNTLPGAASNFAEIVVLFASETYADGASSFPGHPNALELNWNVTNTATKLGLRYNPTSGGTNYLYPYTSQGTTYAELGIKMVFTTDGRVRLYTDLDTTGTWSQKYYGPHNITNFSSMQIYLAVVNKDSTSYTGSFQKVEVYNADTVTFPNIVHLPYNATPITTATGTRAGEDGNISYYTNPTTELRFLEPAADYYKGSVKLLSTNNSASASRQVFGTDINLTPTTTTLKNAFTQLTFDADEVIIKGWDGAAWNAINTIHFTDDIDFIRPLFISPDRVVIQINGTKWTMLRSSPLVTVEHPNTILEYTLRDTYVSGSGTTSSPGAAADIAMTADTDYYYKIHDAASDSYSLVIGKRDKTTIKSDSLPADTITAIGWFKKGASGIDAADSLVQQWYKQTRTGISLKQII
jgi:hypothetical protein